MSERASWIAVLAIFVLRLAVSLHGIDHGLPEAYEPDIQLVRQSLHFRGEAPATPEHLAAYPQLVSRLMALMPRPSAIGAISAGEELDAHLAFAARDFHASRLVVAILGACAVPLTWILARHFLARSWALLASVFLATSLLHFDYSQQARPHAPLATFVLAALLASAALARRPSPARYLLAGVTAGLPVGALHSGALVLFAGLAAHLYAARARGWRAHLWLFVPVLFVALSLILFYPFLFDGTVLSLQGTPDEGPSDFPHRINTLDGSGFAKLWGFFLDYDPLMWGLALAGACVWVVRAIRARRLGEPESRTELVVFAAGLLPYLIVIGIYSRTFVRFLEPLVPFAAVAAAWSVRELARSVGMLSRARIALWASIVLIILFPTYSIVRLANLRAAPDTYTLCADWIRAHADIGSDRILVTPTISLPLFQVVVRGDAQDLRASPAALVWYRYLWDLPVEALPFPVWHMLPITRGGVPYTSVLEYPGTPARAAEILTNLRGTYAVVTSGGKPLDIVRDAAIAKGELVGRVSPWNDDSVELPMGLDFYGRLYWWKVLKARHYGPLLEIYRLR